MTSLWLALLEKIRAKVLRRQYEFSKHAVDQSIIRDITVAEVEEAIAEVTYTLEHAGRFYIIEHVPARVCKETGEHFFSPEAVEHIQALIKSNRKPDRVIETPVYQYT